jgi:alpha-glucosidase
VTDAGRPQEERRRWWRDTVLYHVYCRSFADSDGDGVGDLRGVIDHLDHLAWLGVGGIWLSPTMPSPNADWGYDVSDYGAVDPELGSLDDLDELVARAGRLGIRVLLDLVANHTSDRHPWFVEARSSRTSARRDWYLWADPDEHGKPPNNWLSFIGGPAWSLDEGSRQLYLHNFLDAQPDLDWWNPEVRRAFDDILSFWFDRGIAGFRIDTCNRLIKDRQLRDNPPADPDDPHHRITGMPLRQLHNANRPEVHDVLRGWRRIADAYDPPRLLLGETFVFDLADMAAYHGDDDEIQLALNLPFMFAPLSAPALREVVEATEAALHPRAWPLWVGSTHDAPRLATRWCGDDPARVRCALLMLLMLRGTPLLYYGDEIGMGDTPIPAPRVRDPLGRRPDRPGRDGARTPMRWHAGPNGGYCPEGVEPWLPLGAQPGIDVASQRDDPGSVLRLCRDAIRLRAGEPELRRGTQRSLPSPPRVWAWRRGDALTVALNLDDAPAVLADVAGTVLLGTDREREGAATGGGLELRPWEGVVVRH